MLRRLCHDHVGRTTFFYFDIPFEETVRRHATRPQAKDFTADDMRGWYVHRDLLGFVDEQIIAASATLEETVLRIERAALRQSSAAPPPGSADAATR
ncbi:MAG TPA: kinase, partial [Actinopolymorphaceae bacterium]